MPNTYKTRQDGIISACLSLNSGKLLSAKEICGICTDQGTPVGLVTVYRKLERLIRDGKVKKVVSDDSSGVRFGWVGAEGKEEAFFLKCDSCGKLVPADCSLLDEVTEHMSQEHGFRIDAGKSVLYGRCQDCGDGANRI